MNTYEYRENQEVLHTYTVDFELNKLTMYVTCYFNIF